MKEINHLKYLGVYKWAIVKLILKNEVRVGHYSCDEIICTL